MMETFDDMSWKDKTDLLRKRGVSIVTMNHQTYIVTLLALDNFLVERYYNITTQTLETILDRGIGDSTGCQ